MVTYAEFFIFFVCSALCFFKCEIILGAAATTSYLNLVRQVKQQHSTLILVAATYSFVIVFHN
jgi:hypothetical protein